MSIFSKHGKSGKDLKKGSLGAQDPMHDSPFRTMPLQPSEKEQAILDQKLLSAVATSDVRSLKEALSMGANPRKWDDGSMTPLMLAAMNGPVEIGLSLLDAGANPLAKIKDGIYAGWDAMAFARTHGNKKFCQMLERFTKNY